MNSSMTSAPISGVPRAAPASSLGRLVPSLPAALATAPTLLMLFVASIPLPAYFFIGGTRLTFTRMLLLVLFIPLMIRLFSGKAGRILAIDILMFLFSAWMAIVLLYHEGLGRIPLAGATVMEFLGGYLVGRTLVRNATDYRLLLRYMLVAMLILLPFALLEFKTNQNLLRDAFATVFNSYYKSPTQTWREGFARVASGFEHPILFGLFCTIMVAPFFYLRRRTPVRGAILAALPFGMTYLSLSSAPLIAAGLAGGLIGWDIVTRGKWKPLIWMVSLIFVFLSIVSNRGPVLILIDNLTFNAHTAWIRVWQYHYGSAEVMRNPFLGIGLGTWQRPGWLAGSIDNFWLVIALRYGLPGIGLLWLALGAGIWAVTRTKGLNEQLRDWRTGYVIALTGLYFTLATVHIWGDVSSLLLCFVGAGMWFCTAGTAEPAVETAPAAARRQVNPRRPSVVEEAAPQPATPSRRLPTTRFAQSHTRGTTQSPSPLQTTASHTEQVTGASPTHRRNRNDRSE